MRSEILKNLKDLERENDIKVLFACESGSRAWGFASADSDYDVRFIYVHKIDWYLSLKPQKDTIEKFFTKELDFSGWDIRKALNLFSVSNFSIFEWLDSPIIYLKDDDFFAELSELKGEFFNPLRVFYSYFSLANAHIKKYFKSDEVGIKRLLYVLRALLVCKWILKYKTQAPTLFANIYSDKNVCADELLADLNEILNLKMSSLEGDKIIPSQSLKRFISDSVKEFETPTSLLTLPQTFCTEKLAALLCKTIKNFK